MVPQETCFLSFSSPKPSKKMLLTKWCLDESNQGNLIGKDVKEVPGINKSNNVDDEETQDKHWTPGVFKKPLVRRVPDISRRLQIPSDLNTKTTKIPEAPPWKEFGVKLKTDLIQATSKENSEEKYI